jgi:patatin-like phospholipase/acyl hydrolase
MFVHTKQVDFHQCWSINEHYVQGLAQNRNIYTIKMEIVWNKMPQAISLLNQYIELLLIPKAINSSIKVCTG